MSRLLSLLFLELYVAAALQQDLSITDQYLYTYVHVYSCVAFDSYIILTAIFLHLFCFKIGAWKRLLIRKQCFKGGKKNPKKT